MRKTALAAHAAAHDINGDNAARSAARAAAQALSAADVHTYAIAAAIYAATAVRDTVKRTKAEVATTKEREWQLRHLPALSER